MSPRRCSSYFHSSDLWLAGLLAAVAVATVPRAAHACAGEASIEAQLTFDPQVLGPGVPPELYFDPYTAGFFGTCTDCPKKELLSEWASYLGPSVKSDDWSRALFDASLEEIDGLIFKLQKKAPSAPRGWEASTVVSAPDPAREKVIAALYFVGFARRVEPFAMAVDSWDERGRKEKERRIAAAGDPLTLQKNGEKALARVKDAWLAQRWAFQVLRLRFYRRDWAGVVSFHADKAAQLEGPSPSLAWRARYYLAGALRRSGDVARASVELARIHVGYTPLAGAAASDFAPEESSDWERSLALATTPREKAALWRLVGLRKDAVVAIGEILKVDPRSDLAALLAVRELNRVEVAGDLKALPELQKVAGAVADAGRGERPAVFDLVAEHAAALRGDLATTRSRRGKVLERAKGDATITAQADASLALALAQAWRPGKADVEAELTRALKGTSACRARGVVQAAVRAKLGGSAREAKKLVEAELLAPKSWEPDAPDSPWRDPAFVKALLARVDAPASDFEREVVVGGSGYSHGQLVHELAMLHLARGELAAAAQALDGDPTAAQPLGTDPFVVHLTDCHDCDHEKYRQSPWTRRRLVSKLVELEKQAGGTGEPAARAAYDLGIAWYNVTQHGNARVVFGDTHQVTLDTTRAERRLKQAFDGTKDRERKARAATMAAKCELARTSASASTTWYPVLASLADTKYHAEVLRECAWYSTWRSAR